MINTFKLTLLIFIITTFFIIFRDRYDMYIKLVKTKVKINYRNLYTEKAGLNVLSEEVQNILFAIDTFNFKDYRFMYSFDRKPLVIEEYQYIETFQRVNEAAWPVRMDSTSRNLIGLCSQINTIVGLNIKFKYKNICVGTY